MEPSNLNPLPDDPDQMIALLRHHSPVLPDDGFSARVLTALPPSRAQHWMMSPLFAGAVIAGASAGFGFALFRGASWNTLVDGLGQVAHEISHMGPGISESGIFLALVLTGLSLLIPYLLNRNRSRVGQ